jgi:predicted dienelactone hydrolase
VVPDAGLRVAARRLALAAAAVAILAWSLGCGGAAHGSGAAARDVASRRASVPAPAPASAQAQAPTPVSPPRQSVFSIGLRVLHLVDRSRTLRDGEPRTLSTYVRYPAQGPADGRDHLDATPAHGQFPLIVFGHGFAVTPTIYAPLMRSWTRAGFIVAAPVFPLGNANAPGGPSEPDLVHQPADMSYVISSLLEGGGPLAGLVDPARIAVAGQSDGGDTALAVAYDPRYRDPRVRAAVILSGAEIPYTGSFAFPAAGPPLLATQGTDDTINPPELTETFFAAAHRPKYLLWLTGAEHLPPYTDGQPDLGIVERVSAAFLERYLDPPTRPRVSLRRMYAAASVPGRTKLQAYP